MKAKISLNTVANWRCYSRLFTDNNSSILKTMCDDKKIKTCFLALVL